MYSPIRSRQHDWRNMLGMAILGLQVLAPASQAEPPNPQSLRFAIEGRANLSGMMLACGRSAKATVAALCVISDRAKQAAPRSDRFVTRTQTPSPTLPQILDVIRIPSAQRGSITLSFHTDDPMIRASVIHGATFVTEVVAKHWLPKSDIHVLALPPSESRAHASSAWGRSYIHLRMGVLDVETAIHEIGHHIETDHAPVLAAAKRFLKRRGRGESALPLRDLTGLTGYAPNEVTVRANWATRGGDHYNGKFYGPAVERATGTELISMGLERLYKESDAFFKADADYFLFLLLTLQTSAS